MFRQTTNAGPIFNALTSEPIVPSLPYSGFTGEGNQFYNPFLKISEQDDRQFLTDLITSTEAPYKVTDRLSYTFNGGGNFTRTPLYLHLEDGRDRC